MQEEIEYINDVLHLRQTFLPLSMQSVQGYWRKLEYSGKKKEKKRPSVSKVTIVLILGFTPGGIRIYYGKKVF